jgi:hypothetical protein
VLFGEDDNEIGETLVLLLLEKESSLVRIPGVVVRRSALKTDRCFVADDSVGDCSSIKANAACIFRAPSAKPGMSFAFFFGSVLSSEI